MSDTDDFAIFDRPLARRRRAARAHEGPHSQFLFARMADDLVERLGAVERHFARVLVQGSRGGLFAAALRGDPRAARKCGFLVECDVAPALVPRGGVVADEESLPFGHGRFALAVSLGVLHGLNDLPGALLQIAGALAPDGLFLGAMLGGETLNELRHSFAQAESEVEGGVSPRVAPFADLRDAAGLLQRAGLALPVADRDVVRVTYETPLHLMRDLRAMGETNALIARRRKPLRRATLARMIEIYRARFAMPGGRVEARFEIITLTGWKPDASQQTPLKPGSATHRLADVLPRKTD